MMPEYRQKRITVDTPGRSTFAPGLVFGLIFFGLLVLVGAYYSLYLLLSRLGERGTALVSAGLILVLPLVFWTGYFFGRTETRGFLRAADLLADHWFDKLAAAVTVRENSTIKVHNATKPPAQTGAQVAVVLPGVTGTADGMRRITDQTTGEGSILDL